MGVLRVSDGTTLSPDWRDVGCGTPGSVPPAINTRYVVQDGSYNTTANQVHVGYAFFWKRATVRFTGLPDLAGKTITSAVLRVKLTSTQAGGANTRIYLDNTQNPATPTSGPDLLAKTHTTAFTAWTGPAASGGDWVDSPDFSAVLQEVVDAHGTLGAIQLLHDYTGTDNSDEFVYHGEGSGFEPMLLLTYTPPPTGRLELWDGTRWMREVCTADTGIGPNLLTSNQNGLETGAATGWAAQPDPGFGTVFTVISADTTHAHTGAYSLKVSTSAAIDRYFATPAGTSGFAVTPGTSYEVSAFVWRSDLSDASRLAFDVRWYNSSGSLLSTSTGFLTYITPREAWEPVDFGAYTAPAGAVYGQLYGHTSSANNLTITYWLDDIVIGANVERHPLRIEDPSSPGTWIDVACMTPA